MKLPLYVPVSLLEASQEERERVCNGCGAKGGINVPDTFYGLSVTSACNIHDWMFHKGISIGDYYFANAMFFWNMIAIIVNGSNWFTMLLRAERALKYFLGVMFSAGREAYWKEKRDTNEALTITIKGKFIIKD